MASDEDWAIHLSKRLIYKLSRNGLKMRIATPRKRPTKLSYGPFVLPINRVRIGRKGYFAKTVPYGKPEREWRKVDYRLWGKRGMPNDPIRIGDFVALADGED